MTDDNNRNTFAHFLDGGGIHNQHHHYHHHGDPNANAEAWPIPDRETLQRRWAFRQAVLRETLELRRVHTPGDAAPQASSMHHRSNNNNSNSDNPDVQMRNLAFVLWDRERYGSTPHHRRCLVPDAPPAETLLQQTHRKRSPSPATVFDSPVSTTAAPNLYQNSSSSSNGGNHGTPQEQQQQQSQPIQQAQQPMQHGRTSKTISSPRIEAMPAPNLSQEEEIPMDIDETMTTGIPAGDASDPCSPSHSDPQSPASTTVFPHSISKELVRYAEHVAALQSTSAFLPHLGGDDELDEEGHRPTSSRAVSTISVAFGHDGRTMASTHGDHSVKITCCHTGRILRSLEGHPRTPWTVKYHPTDANRVASGCLGYQVRVWHWPTNECLQMVRLEYAIISLSFHPRGDLLAIANGTRLHFWGVNDADSANSARATTPTNSNNTTTASDRPDAQRRSERLTEIDQRHMLRCVHFPPDGKSLIIGGVNPADEPRRRRGDPASAMSFYLRLWDFDPHIALGLGATNHPASPNHHHQHATSSGGSNANAIHNHHHHHQHQHPSQPQISGSTGGASSNITMTRRAISNPRTFVPRALLYNDGGFDVSPDGKTLCACVEYWLPEGVNNAMELMKREEANYQLELEEIERERNAAAAAAAAAATNRPELVTSRSMERNSTKSPLPSGPISPVQTPTRRASTTEMPPPPRIVDALLRTPENPGQPHLVRRLSPPSPPGQRYAGGLPHRQMVSTAGSQNVPETLQRTRGATGNTGTGAGGTNSSSNARGVDSSTTTPPPPPPPPPPPAPGGPATRSVHPLSMITRTPQHPETKGRYVPHVVTISLETNPIPAEVNLRIPRGKPYGAVAMGYRPRLGQLIEACPLDGAKASAVTCVKFSPSTDYCLIGYGVREPVTEGVGGHLHPVTALYRIPGGMTHVSTMLSGDDDVNIARFHPDSGHGYVYGTKQGRVRVLAPRTWMYYHC